MYKLKLTLVMAGMAGVLAAPAQAQTASSTAAPASVPARHLCDPLSSAQMRVKPTRSAPLWPAGTPGIPGEDGLSGAQSATPHIDLYVAADNPTHTVVVVFPGGGYTCLSQGIEGADMAEWWNGRGVSVAVVTGVSSRPDFLVLGYPVITMKDGTHAHSRNNLLGAAPPAALIDQYSAENRVNGNTPPTFIFSTGDDATVPIVENGVEFYKALVRAGVPAELHIYEHGHHGLGLAQESPEVSTWPQMLANWTAMHGWMGPTYATRGPIPATSKP